MRDLLMSRELETTLDRCWRDFVLMHITLVELNMVYCSYKIVEVTVCTDW